MQLNTYESQEIIMTKASGRNSATSWHRVFGMGNDASCHITDRGPTVPRLITLVLLYVRS